MERKHEQVRRYLRAMKHVKSPDELQEERRRTKERKAQRKKRSRGRHDWAAEADETHEYERIRRAPARDAVRGKGDARGRRRAAAEAVEHAGLRRGLVVSVTSGRVRVRSEGEELEADLAQELARTQKSSVAVGDEVGLAERPGAAPRVVRVHERRSLISRPDPARPGVERVIAANVDRAVIVTSVRRPALRHRLIDRYLVALERGGVEPVVCANKVDLFAEDGAQRAARARRRVSEVLAPYAALGVPVLLTSAGTGEGVDELRELLGGRTVVFVGQSGVGKSSLLNAMAPELELRIGRVRSGDGKGRHTTTSSTLLELAGGTRVIDTPGIRGFELADVDRASLSGYFPDLAVHAAACRFGDCSHHAEPGCAVRAAVEAGAVPEARYDAYRRIWATLE